MQIVCLVIVSPVAGISPFLPFLSQVSLIHWVYCFQNNVHCSTIYNSQGMEATWMSINRLMERKMHISIYTMEYYSAIKRNTFKSVLMRWINLKPIIQSEVSQKETNTVCCCCQSLQSCPTLCNPRDVMHIYGIQKDGTNNPTCRAAKEIQTQRTDFWTQWEKGREQHQNIHITICKTDDHCKFDA